MINYSIAFIFWFSGFIYKKLPKIQNYALWSISKEYAIWKWQVVIQVRIFFTWQTPFKKIASTNCLCCVYETCSMWHVCNKLLYNIVLFILCMSSIAATTPSPTPTPPSSPGPVVAPGGASGSGGSGVLVAVIVSLVVLILLVVVAVLFIRYTFLIYGTL